MTRGRKIHRYLSWLILGLAAVQFFLAGLGVFRAKPAPGLSHLFESSTFDAHRGLGSALQALALILLVMALLARRRVRLSLVLFVLMVLQSVFVSAAKSAPVVGALHPVNGLAILAIAHVLTRPAPGDEITERARAEIERAQKKLEDVHEALQSSREAEG